MLHVNARNVMYFCNLTLVKSFHTGKRELQELRGTLRYILLWVGGDSFHFEFLLWHRQHLYMPEYNLPSLFFLCHWNVSYTWNMSSRTETSPVLITAQSNKPVLHNSSNIAIFTCEAELVIYSWAAFPHVLLTPTEQGVLHQGHNGWFDLKRSNYPQQ